MARLESELRAYLGEGKYPFHMPGHKRKNVTGAALPYEYDMTEIPATDDLHEAEGILREAMERTASLYHADQSWYLVNGSTCGNLAGLFACTHQGGEIIAARNCHRSVYHGIQLRGLQVHWLLPEYDTEFGIYGSVSPEKLSELIKAYPHTEAVVLTSPSYEGVLSDIRSIAELCHAHGIALLVDEAHGAHFSVERKLYGISTEKETFPQSAIELGADISVQSPHKTLPSLTQTAWLHFKSELIKEKTVEKMLGIFETSSPSYPLMVSLDSCTEFLLEQGVEYFRNWHENLRDFYREMRGLQHFKLLYGMTTEDKTPDWRKAVKRHSGFYDFDESKILINTGDSGLSGAELSEIFRERFGLEMEMSSGQNVLAMTAMTDEREAYQKLAQAVWTLDREAGDKSGKEQSTAEELLATVSTQLPEIACRISEAVEAEAEVVSLEESAGKISTEYVYLYPPGIPMLIPGERISEALLQFLHTLKSQGIHIHFTESGSDSEEICVMSS